MVKEIVDAHKISYCQGVIGCSDFKLTAPEIFLLECSKAKRFRKEGIVEHSLLICHKAREHKKGALNVYYKQDAKPQFKLSKVPLKNWEVMGSTIFAMNFYE